MAAATAYVEQILSAPAYTVRYDAVNAMLLNEFLKEHSKVEELEKQVEGLAAGLQKVSDELALAKSALRIAVANP